MNELGAVWGAKERLMMLADNIGQLTAAATRTNAMRMWATLFFLHQLQINSSGTIIMGSGVMFCLVL